MAREVPVWTLLLVWVALAAASVLVPMQTPATDFGMSRGLNRVVLFAQFQMAAILAALFCFFLAKRLAPGWRRWLARLPLGLELLLGLVVVGMIVWGDMQRPAPGAGAPVPDRPVTAPAAGTETPAPKPDG